MRMIGLGQNHIFYQNSHSGAMPIATVQKRLGQMRRDGLAFFNVQDTKCVRADAEMTPSARRPFSLCAWRGGFQSTHLCDSEEDGSVAFSLKGACSPPRPELSVSGSQGDVTPTRVPCSPCFLDFGIIGQPPLWPPCLRPDPVWSGLPGAARAQQLATSALCTARAP